MIVIGILAAIAGLALPPIFRGLTEREFDAMLERVQQAAGRCRTDAMDEGKPRLLVAVLDRGEWEFGGQAVDPESIGAAVTSEEPSAGDKGPPRRSYAAMPLGYKVVTGSSLSTPQDEPAAAPPGDAAAGQPGGQQVAIAVFLPDGTVYAGESAVLLGPKVAGKQLAARIRLNRWTGAATCEIFDPKPPEKDPNQPKDTEVVPEEEKEAAA